MNARPVSTHRWPAFSRSASCAARCAFSALQTDVRQYQGPAALLGLERLQNELLAHSLQLLPHAQLPRFEVDVLPSEARGFPEPKAASQRHAEQRPEAMCVPATFKNAPACATSNGSIGRFGGGGTFTSSAALIVTS